MEIRLKAAGLAGSSRWGRVAFSNPFQSITWKLSSSAQAASLAGQPHFVHPQPVMAQTSACDPSRNDPIVGRITLSICSSSDATIGQALRVDGGTTTADSP
jgi:hypothetical protein